MDLHADVPGATPPDDLSGLRIKGDRSRAGVNKAEFENMVLAMVKYLARRPTRRMAPFTRQWMLKLHKEAFGRVWTWAGKIRKSEKNIGLPPEQVASALENLAGDLHYWREHKSMDLQEQAALLHWRAAMIHPFENCNGRWARLLTNIWLKQNGGPVVVWPEESIAETTSVIRSEYIKALQAADAGDHETLMELHKRHLEAKNSSQI